ncbi:MAG: biotin synthase, partial [Burkholderiales bacterium]|nr:biotin synthase [Burkholderiales bacterium]
PRWLDWWGFLGGSAEAVAAALPKSRRQVVEPDATLAARSRTALRSPWWLRWRSDAGREVLDEAAAAVTASPMLWANMMLHTAPDPAAVLAQWHAALAVDGFLMFSTLGPDSLLELREIYREQGWPAPHPPYTDMHDWGDRLVQAGFADPVMDQEMLTLTFSSPQALLAELRQLGGHLGLGRFDGLRTPRWRARLHQALAQRADAQGRIALRFEIVYGHAFKAPPRPGRGEPATVSLESLRANLRQRRAAP